MMSTISSTLYFIIFMALPPLMLLMLMNTSLIIEWEMSSMLGTCLKFEMMLEWSSMLYSLIVLFISSNVLKFSKEYMKNDSNKLRFTYIVLMFIISMNMLIYIPNILCLLIGWDGLGITSFILIIYYNNPRSLSAGMLTMMTNRLGDMFLLMSITMTLNSGEFLPIYHLMANKHFTYQWLGILMAALTKSAQMPFSSWLPAAMAAPTPVSALVHSSTLVTAGIFIMYRFNTMISESKMMQIIIMTLSMLTIITAGSMAIYENDMKKIIALSTLSQLGLMSVPMAMSMHMLSFFHMTTHAMFKALLFITAGNLIMQNNHNQDMRLFGLSSKLTPVTSSSMLISLTALISIPFMTGYYSKHKIMEWSSSMYTNSAIYTMLMLMIALTSMYSMRLFLFLMVMPMKKYSISEQTSLNDSNKPMITMSLMSISTGSMIQWLSPMKETYMSMNENMKSTAPNLMMLTSMSFMAISAIYLNYYKKHIKMNKLLNLMMFITPISTQFMLPAYFKLSLMLSKYLDQSWLEKLLSLGLPNKLINLSLKSNLLLPKYPQNILLNSAMLSTISMTMLMLY